MAFFFHFCFPLVVFIWFIAIAKTSSSLVNMGGKGRQTFLTPDFSGDVLNFSPFKMMFLAESSLYIAFIMLRYVPCVPILSRTFIINRCWILPKTVSKCNEMIMQFLSLVYLWGGLCLLIYMYWIILHPWDEVDLIVQDSLFDVFLNSLCKCFTENVYIYVHQNIDL